MTKAKPATMTEEEANMVPLLFAGVQCEVMENPFNKGYWVCLLDMPTGPRCLTSVTQAEWFHAGWSAIKRAHLP